jgi:hypothetical protein
MLDVQISASVPVWHSIVKKRQCWIAQYGLWKDIITPVQNLVGITEQDLPCANGSCPYIADADLRYEEGKDPNPPCPRHAVLYNRSYPKDKFTAALKEASIRPGFWAPILDEAMIEPSPTL